MAVSIRLLFSINLVHLSIKKYLFVFLFIYATSYSKGEPIDAEQQCSQYSERFNAQHATMHQYFR